MEFNLKISVQQIFNIFFVSLFYQQKFPLTVIEFTLQLQIFMFVITHTEQPVLDQLSFKIMHITNKSPRYMKNRKKKIVPPSANLVR